MTDLLIHSKDTGKPGIFAEISAAQAGWEYLNMAALRMNRGEKYSGQVGEHEHVSVLLGGRAHFHTSAGDFLNVGRRPDVFNVECLGNGDEPD